MTTLTANKLAILHAKTLLAASSAASLKVQFNISLESQRTMIQQPEDWLLCGVS